MEDRTVELAINDCSETRVLFAVRDAGTMVHVLEPFKAIQSDDDCELEVREREGALTLAYIDKAHVMVMEATIPVDIVHDDLLYCHWETGTRFLINLDKTLDALKWFGSEMVALAVYDGQMVISNDEGRRHIRLPVMDEDYKSIKLPELHPEESATIRMRRSKLRRFAGIAGIGQTACLSIAEGEFSIRVTTETETAELRMQDTGYALDVRTNIPVEYLAPLTKRIKDDDPGDSASLLVAQDHPLEVAWCMGPVDLRALIAPKIEVDR